MTRSTRLAEVLANTYSRAAASVIALTTNENNEFRQALDKLQDLSDEYDIPLVAVGGMAVIHHGVIRTTTDIDVIVAQDQMDELVELAQMDGFQVDYSQRGWHHLLYKGVGIDLIPEGAKARDDAPTTIPGPAALGVNKGLQFVCLHGLMELKLSSARSRDEGDVVELIKRAPPEEIAVCENHLKQVHPQYHDLFLQLYQKAKRELQQEQVRG